MANSLCIDWTLTTTKAKSPSCERIDWRRFFGDPENNFLIKSVILKWNFAYILMTTISTALTVVIVVVSVAGFFTATTCEHHLGEVGGGGGGER